MTAAGALVCVLGFAAEDKAIFKDQKDKASYCIGLNIGNSLKQQALDIDPEKVAAGIRDVLSNAKPLLTEQEVQATLMEFQKLVLSQRAEKGKKNKTDGEAYLAENKKKKGVETLPSGLQYSVITAGKGKKPKATDTVTTHYRGTLIDGTEFDSSYKGGEPVSFPVKGVIPGWTEALQLMPVGSKWKLFIPSDLAYGESGQGPIPPHSALVFEIELLGISGEDGAKK